MIYPLAFFCIIEECAMVVRYEYILRDRMRDKWFSIGFELGRDQLQHARIDLRVGWDERCMRELWRGVEIESPDTFSEANGLGWIS